MTTVKKPNQITEPPTDENFNEAFRLKMESQFVYNGSASATVVKSYQSSYSGYFDVSGTGSATVDKTIGFSQRQTDITYVNAHALNTSARAIVTNVTATGITINIAPILLATTAISNVTTATIRVYFELRSSNP